ncbi:MAG: thioredoxin domain-containing protein, partial [Stellaceae bacterium]
YANLCRAALALHEATGEHGYLAQARVWIATLDRDYWDDAEGGYFFAAADTGGLIARAKTAADSPNPAGNGTLVGVLARLALLFGEDAYRQRAEAIVAMFSGEIARSFFPLATLLNNIETLTKPLQIVLVGKREAADFDALRRAVYGVSLPNRVVLALAPGESLPEGHPAHGKGLVGGRAAAYVCDGPVCSLPLIDPAALAAELAQRR